MKAQVGLEFGFGKEAFGLTRLKFELFKGFKWLISSVLVAQLRLLKLAIALFNKFYNSLCGVDLVGR